MKNKSQNLIQMTEHLSPRRSSRIIIIGCALASVISATALLIAVVSRSPRIGIVRIQKVLERYEGALDAKKAFRTTTLAWGANVDTLQSEINRLMFEVERSSTSQRRVRDSMSTLLRTREAQLLDYRKAVESKTIQEQQLLTESVVNHVRTAAESVAKNSGVDCFLAIHDEGMIVAASETVDLTDEVLVELRKTYRGQLRAPARASGDDVRGTR